MGREVQNNKMPKVVKSLIFITISVTLLANIVLIIWAAQGTLDRRAKCLKRYLLSDRRCLPDNPEMTC
jgi:hypothetical protein